MYMLMLVCIHVLFLRYVFRCLCVYVCVCVCVLVYFHSHSSRNTSMMYPKVNHSSFPLWICHLQLNVDPSGPALDLEVPLEVIIGTIPLRQVVEQYPPRPAVYGTTPQAGYGFGTTHPPPEGATAPYPPLDPSAPPAGPVMPPNSIPNLRECLFGYRSF